MTAHDHFGPIDRAIPLPNLERPGSDALDLPPLSCHFCQDDNFPLLLTITRLAWGKSAAWLEYDAKDNARVSENRRNVRIGCFTLLQGPANGHYNSVRQ